MDLQLRNEFQNPHLAQIAVRKYHKMGPNKNKWGQIIFAVFSGDQCRLWSITYGGPSRLWITEIYERKKF